jgi:CubicO group peptidase (beta-lactamase class C family)
MAFLPAGRGAMRRPALGAIASPLLVLGLSISVWADRARAQVAADTAGLDPRLEEVRDFLVREIDEGTVPSLAISVAHGGNVVWEEAFGLADKKSERQADSHTMYRLGSISKPITATAVMRLVQAGLVDLDAPIEQYLGGPSLRYYAGAPGEVTVRRVLQHRAGLPPYNQSFYLDEEPERRPFGETVRRYGIVVFEPGWSFVYSNIGYMLLARAVEVVTALHFTRYVRDSLFTPLGMGTAQVYAAGDELLGPAATPYFGLSGEPVPRSVYAYPGSADVYCSAHDLLRFAMLHLGAHLPDQRRVLADSTIEAMRRQEPPSNTRYGLGWYFDVDDLGFRSIYHGGQETGVSNFMVLVPSEDVAVVILTNSDYDASRLLHIQGAVRAALIPGYDGRNLWALTASDTSEARSDTAAALGERPESTQKFPEEMLGTWEGRIVAYDREIAAVLVLSDEGGIVRLSNQEAVPVDFSVVSSDFLLGTFAGSIPTPDMARYDDGVRLALRFTGDRLTGQATAVGWREDRQTQTEQSAWIELRKQ